MKPLNERRNLVEKCKDLSQEKQCDLLSIHRSGLYYKPLEGGEENLKIMRLLDEQYFLTPFYGALKLMALLKENGFSINIKRVRRLMKVVNWRTIYREPKTSISNQLHKKYPYLLRHLKISEKNQVWATDITYIPMQKGFMYLIAIVDLHTRYVLNWSLSNSMTADWCAEVLEEAIKKHGKPIIFNIDQGSQFTSDVFINVLKYNEISISMDGKGRALDNIFVERLWRSVKYEDIYLKAYENGLDLYEGLKKYFEFYNNERFHQSLHYKTPAEIYHQRAVA
ncbi:IS3 family transposase [Frigoriflavimonas asaccharolytica]|uniref:Putative transposase n=1 Tax=Frigoriflavimonas asaccharolytica TaxID=2735899 RepID=A0A8J8G6T5_9FLAO|nr:IS3 family transposase [Frigoriflavimonas asaccharolytica]NRS92396.1 putative transposase [Frigoriflavimonas asaccharolytica]